MASSRKSRANCSFKLNNPDVTPKKFAPSASADVDAAARNTLRGDVFRSESAVVDDVDDDVVDDVVLLSSSSSRTARIVVVVVVVIAAPLRLPPTPLFESRKQRESDVVGIVVTALSCIVLFGKKVWISILHFSIYKKALKRDALDETNAAVARRVVVVVQRELFLVVVFVDVSWERFPSAKTARTFGDVLSSSSSPGKEQQQQRKKLRCSSRDDNDRFSVHGRPRVVVHVREQHFVRDELDRELGQTRDDCNRATFFGPHD